MSINWITVGAQVINFLILVVLLHRFLYKRILAAIDERERLIASRLAQSEETQRQAEQEREEYQTRLKELNEQKDQLLADARTEVQKQRQDWLHRARTEVDTQRRQWFLAVEEETDSFLQELRRQTAHQVCTTVRRVLTDLASVNLEEHMIHVFLKRLRELGDPERNQLREALTAAEQVVCVRSHHEIPQRVRELVRETVVQEMGIPVEVRFEPSTDLLCGIVLESEGKRVGWELGDHLDALDDQVSHFLERFPTAPVGVPEPGMSEGQEESLELERTE